MVQYFTPFPKVDYDIKKNGNKETLTDITLRFKIQNVLKDKVAIYQEHLIKDGERADTIAFKYYDDPTLDWIILLTNNIIDPLFDWPLDYNSFKKMIKDKYSNARSEIHHYEWIIQHHKVRSDGSIIAEKTYVVDRETYDGLAPNDRRVVYAYDYEEKLNDEKRRIKILQPQYVRDILNQIEGVFDR